jgi:hypothetical protein
MHRDAAANAQSAAHGGDFDAAVIERERMAEGQELVRALRSHHAGDDRSVKYRPFLGAVARLLQGERDGSRQAHAHLGKRLALGYRFGADIDHARPPVAIYM